MQNIARRPTLTMDHLCKRQGRPLEAVAPEFDMRAAMALPPTRKRPLSELERRCLERAEAAKGRVVKPVEKLVEKRATKAEVKTANSKLAAERVARATEVDAASQVRLASGETIDARYLSDDFIGMLLDAELLAVRVCMTVAIAQISGRLRRLSDIEKTTSESDRMRTAIGKSHKRKQLVEKILAARKVGSFADQ